jgi:hypothetical protein
MDSETAEDILNDALDLMGVDKSKLEDSAFSYGPISVTVAPKVCR